MFAAPMDVTGVMVAADGPPFDLRGLALLHGDGDSTPVALRAEAAALSQRAGEVVVTRRGTTLPRGWLVTDVRLSRDEDVRDLVGGSDFAPDRTVVLTAAPDTEPRWGSPGEAVRAIGILSPSITEGRVRAGDTSALTALISKQAAAGAGSLIDNVESLAEEPESVRLRVRTSGPRVLVLPDAPYPGWRAYVNGVEEPVWRANVGHRAVLIRGPGVHLVEFSYRSTPYEVGRIVSLASLAVLVTSAVAVLLRSRRR